MRDGTWAAENPRHFYVIAGATYVYLPSWGTMQVELVDKTLPHAGFRFSDLRNDIGLFRVTVYAVYINSVSIIKRGKKQGNLSKTTAASPVAPLLQLKRPLHRNALVRYAALPPAYAADLFQTHAEDCTVIGWGRHIPGSNVSEPKWFIQTRHENEDNAFCWRRHPAFLPPCVKLSCECFSSMTSGRQFDLA